MRKVGASPLGQEAHSRRGEKGRGRGSAAPPRTKSRARPPRPRTHQHDGKSFLQFTWLGHRQLQRHVVRPEIGLLRIHAPRVAHVCRTPGRGLLRAPRVRVRRKSEQRLATGSRPLRDLPGSPPSLRPAPCSARRSLAALRAEPPPGLLHAPRRPSAAPASFPREGSSGRRAPVCMLLRGRAAPCQRCGCRARASSASVSQPGRGRR